MENNIQAKKIDSKKKGIVVSDVADKTVVVSVVTFKNHPKYSKRFKSTKRYRVHDKDNKYKIGDKIEIVSSKPESKGKKYKVV